MSESIKIITFRRTISFLKGYFIMKTCPICNAQVPDDATFCTICGAALAAPEAAPATDKVPAPEAAPAAPEATVYAAPAGAYTPAPVVDPFDHTAEFDAQDISDNKCYAMLVYLMSVVGIIIALLASKESPYLKFHIRQAIKFEVVTILLAIITSVLCWTFIVPIAGGVCLTIIMVLKIICFFQICKGQAKEPAIIRNLKFLK